MGLDMYAFSLDHSPAFATPRDILKYRVPVLGKDLPEGILVNGIIDLDALAVLDVPELETDWPIPIFDTGAAFVDSKYVLPGSTLLCRWRKHPDLHGWMERYWRSMQWHKGDNKKFGKNERVPLDVQALDALEHAVRRDLLPKTEGFFFGESEGAEKDRDLAFIAEARAGGSPRFHGRL